MCLKDICANSFYLMKWNISGYMGKPQSFKKKCAFTDKMKRGLKTFTGMKQGWESHSNANMGFFFFFFNGQGGWLRGQSYWEKWNRKSHPKNWAIVKKHSLSLDLRELICSQLDFSMAIKQWLLSTSHFPSFECPGLLPEILIQSSLSHHRVLEGEDAQRFYQSIERGLLRPLYWDLLRGLLRETKSLN